MRRTVQIKTLPRIGGNRGYAAGCGPVTSREVCDYAIDWPGTPVDFDPRPRHFRFTPGSGHRRCSWGCLNSATSGLMHAAKGRPYSIVLVSELLEIQRDLEPSAFAVERLMISCTGRSAGFSSLRMRRASCAAGARRPGENARYRVPTEGNRAR
jgi:hypothetical protein